MYKPSELNLLADVFLDFGELMLDSGAEIGRVEDSLSRMGAAYGATKTNVFVITSSIELTLTFEDGDAITRTRRIASNGSTDFEKLRKLNALSRSCACSPISPNELLQQIENIRNASARLWKICLGSVLAAGGFTMFFGGSAFDALLSGGFAVLICLMQKYFAPISPNKIFYLFVCSFLTGSCICLVSRFLPMIHIDKVIIGDIMLLVPGIAITNAVRDTLIGDTISGIVKLADSLVWALSLAGGFMLAIFFFAG